jgi:hypothetical protein
LSASISTYCNFLIVENKGFVVTVKFGFIVKKPPPSSVLNPSTLGAILILLSTTQSSTLIALTNAQYSFNVALPVKIG